jgi:hypothetical protein
MLLKDIARALGVDSHVSIINWLNDPDLVGKLEYQDFVDKVKAGLASKQYLQASRIINSITDKDVEKASLLQKATAQGIMIDKARLLDNQPTNISQIEVNLNDYKRQTVEIEGEIEELEAQLAEGQ